LKAPDYTAENINALKQLNNSRTAGTKHLSAIETGCYCKILVFWLNKLLLFWGTFGILIKVFFGLLGRKAVQSRQAIKDGI
jgi:hypothetical protein